MFESFSSLASLKSQVNTLVSSLQFSADEHVYICLPYCMQRMLQCMVESGNRKLCPSWNVVTLG